MLSTGLTENCNSTGRMKERSWGKKEILSDHSGKSVNTL